MAAVASDAATMLAEALQQMDGLISDDQLIMESLKSQPYSCSSKDKVLSLVEELRGKLEDMTRDAKLTIEIPSSTIDFLIGWLKSLQDVTSKDEQRNREQLTNCEKISRLEDEKESLILQVSVLTDQVEAQGEKIRDLEFTKEEMQIKFEEAEQFLESEILKTTNLLNEKLELVTEISTLKMALNEASGRELTGFKENHEAILAEKDTEIEMLKDHIEVLLDEQETANRSHHTEGQPPLALKHQLREKASEVNHLKMEIEALTSACKEKDQQIQEVQQSLSKFKRIEEMLMKANQRKGSDGSPVVSLDGIDSSSVHSADFVTTTSNTSSPEPYGATTPNLSRALFTESYTQAVNNPVTPSLRALKTETPPTTPAFQRKKHGIRASLGKGLMKLRGHKSSSEPNLAQTECEENKNSQIKDNTNEQGNIPKHDEEKKKSSSKFGKAFTKLRRTRSLSMNPEDRIVAGEPLNLRSYTNVNHKDYGDQLELPFSQWSRQMVLSWLDDLGLGHYSSQCGKVITCGQDLLKASPAQLERDMGLKNPLHRKKLQLALQALVSDGADVMGRLSNQWVLGWLDDIGLPQYKDSFSDGSVDGRMLNYLTFSDMLHLKVHNALHHITFKRAIQCLRLHNFHPNCLKRHPVDESWLKGADVLLWTNGRVTEWLRLVDLAEYAPNLRGSGVHGALMILEPRFTAESLAALLSIPTSKTLLRRHLATHFQSLVGTECHQVKEEATADPMFQPLMPGIKHKIVKRTISLGPLRKRGKGDVELDDYVCPMDLEVPPALKSCVVQRSRRSNERSEESMRSRKRSDEDSAFQHMLKEERHIASNDSYEV